MITSIVHIPDPTAPTHSRDMVRVVYTFGRRSEEYPASASHAAALARNNLVAQVSAREWRLPDIAARMSPAWNQSQTMAATAAGR